MIAQNITESYKSFIENQAFPCLAGKAALKKGYLRTYVSHDMSSSDENLAILDAIYKFVNEYRMHNDGVNYFTFGLIFHGPYINDVDHYEQLFWKKINGLKTLDEENYPWDNRVSEDIQSSEFSFSLKSEAFYLIGLHPKSSRAARRFLYPAIVFNPHQQFESLRDQGIYGRMKEKIRARDKKINGSINPMIKDFGQQSEAVQYTGKQYKSRSKCPFHFLFNKS